MRTGIVDVGGGLRDIYGAGVLDLCMDRDIAFDVCIGVSAGAANLSSYISEQRGRALTFYYDYSFRSEYMSMGAYVKSGSYFNLDYVYGELCRHDGENPLNFEAFKRSPKEFITIATEAQTGKAKSFTKDDFALDNFTPLMASASIPLVCRPYEIDGIEYYDGALSNPIPIKKAFEMGCDKVVLVLTKPADTPRKPGKDGVLADLLYKKYPIAAHQLRLRAKRYNDMVAYAKELEREGKVLILSPDDIAGIDTAKKNKNDLMRLYVKGYMNALKIPEFLSE